MALLRKARFVAYKKSVEIVRQGMLMNNVYLLVKGTGTATRLEESSDQDVTNMKEGHLCGEYPLLYEKPSMTTIATEGELFYDNSADSTSSFDRFFAYSLFARIDADTRIFARIDLHSWERA